MAPPRFKTFSGGDLCRSMVNYFNCIVNSVVVSACSAALRTFRVFFFFEGLSGTLARDLCWNVAMQGECLPRWPLLEALASGATKGQPCDIYDAAFLSRFHST